MEGYSVKIVESSKELTAKEKVRIKDFSAASQLDDIIKPGEHFMLDYAFHAIMEVHNEKSKNEKKDYRKIVVVDKAGNAFVTGSESFLTAMLSIIDEMADANEEFQLDCYKVDSKNFQGKQFITCTVI
jgi:hypothetical protein